MRRLLIPVLALGLVTFLAIGCDTLGGEDTGGTVILQGRVVNAQSNTAVTGAVVTAQSRNGAILGRAGTDSLGIYDLPVEIDSTMQIFVTAEKNGRRSSERSQLATAGETLNFPDLKIQGTEVVEPDPGTPAYIQLKSVSSKSIQVKETGGTEVTRLTFVVRDSSNRPISLDFQTGVRFSLGAHPDGGEHLTTEQSVTNNNGAATVGLISGTKAGVVQVFAEVEGKNGEIIRSRPVAITIHGGFPHEPHFSVFPEKFNFQGLVSGLLENEISVLVGDRYTNPVKPGTVVYFETTHGVIEGSTQTDEAGTGGVILRSGRPYPEDGVAVVTATTVNRNNEYISVKTPILFTSGGTLEVISTPTQTFSQPLDLENPADVETLMNALGTDSPFGGYRFILEDRNGNPLPQGTLVGFRAGGTEVGADGDVAVTLGDTEFVDQNGDGDALDYEDVVRGLGFTEFSASAVRRDDPLTDENPDLESITFILDGPQSKREYTFVEPNTSSSSSLRTTFSMRSTGGSPAFIKNGEVLATWQNGRLRWKR